MLTLPSRFALRFSAYGFGFVLLGTARWLRQAFGDVSLEQVLWHLLHAEAAAFRVSSIFALEFSVEALLVPCVLAVVAALAHGLVSEPLSRPLRGMLRTVPMAAALYACGAVAMQFALPSYVAAYWQPDRFAEDYVEPRRVTLTPGVRRDLVLIYVESLETSYRDTELFGEDLLAPLETLGGRSYPKYRAIEGMNWTIEGIVSTQCGVPLKTYFEADLRSHGRARVFLPGATCLGDVLLAQGYHNVFMGGAPLSFSGKGRFFRDHGYTEIWGRRQWEKAGARPDELNLWGLNDHALLARARKRLAELHAAGQPFNLTLLTVDTHHPSGLMSPACKTKGERGFTGVLHCTVGEVADFVRFASTLENTTVVVLGDHLAVENPLMDRLERAGPNRGIFNLFLGRDMPPLNRDEIIAFDLFPTLLELTGTQVRGDRLALGYSAVGEAEAVRPAEWVDDWSLAKLTGSTSYDRLWSTDAGPLPEFGAPDN